MLFFLAVQSIKVLGSKSFANFGDIVRREKEQPARESRSFSETNATSKHLELPVIKNDITPANGVHSMM